MNNIREGDLMVKKKQEAIFISRWKDKVRDIVKLQYPDISSKKLDVFMDDIIKKNMVNPKVGIVNNYINKVVKTDALSLIDSIENNNLIIGGQGVLYQPHDNKENPILHYIMDNMALRKEYQRLKKEATRGTDEWLTWDIYQLIVKILINTLVQIYKIAQY